MYFVDIISIKKGFMSTINDLLFEKKKLVKISPIKSVFKAVKKMNTNTVGSILVLNGKKLVGIFTERDLMKRIVENSLDPKQVLVGEVMTDKVAVGVPTMYINDAAALMSQNKIRHLPIVENGEVVGIVSSGDLFKWQLEQSNTTIQHLENYFLN